MPADYFSVAEFRAYAGDARGARLDESTILAYQEEVIERLEEWAYSAWPNVNPDATPEEVAAGGVSVAPRSITEGAKYGQGTVELSRVPVIAITTPDPEMLGGYTVAPNSGLLYEAMTDTGAVGLATVSYTYGYTTCPRSIKRPCMMAVASMAVAEGGPGIPANVERYSTEGTTFDFAVATIPGEVDEPWPWDRTASLLVRTRWQRHRPGRFAAV